MRDIKPIGSLWHYIAQDYYIEVLWYEERTLTYWCNIKSKNNNALIRMDRKHLKFASPYELPKEPESFEKYLICNATGALISKETNWKCSNIYRIKIAPEAEKLEDVIKVIERVK
ncbi:MAG: hypothetical protein WCJ33_07850 [Pseudomonadota bacterium]